MWWEARISLIVNLAERKRTLLVDHVDVVRAVIQKVKAMHLFHIDAWWPCPITCTHCGHCPWLIAIARRAAKRDSRGTYRRMNAAAKVDRRKVNEASGKGAIASI
jgi:hypothetical protein